MRAQVSITGIRTDSEFMVCVGAMLQKSHRLQSISQFARWPLKLPQLPRKGREVSRAYLKMSKLRVKK